MIANSAAAAWKDRSVIRRAFSNRRAARSACSAAVPVLIAATSWSGSAYRAQPRRGSQRNQRRASQAPAATQASSTRKAGPQAAQASAILMPPRSPP